MAETHAALSGGWPERLRQLESHSKISRDFLGDEPMRSMTLDGRPGLALSVRLTSYRALPLSCISDIGLSIDGVALDLGQARLGLNGLYHPLEALAGLAHTSWFILDVATLFVPMPALPGSGAHVVAGMLRTTEPYITAGRFAFYSHSSRTLQLERSTHP